MSICYQKDPKQNPKLTLTKLQLLMVLNCFRVKKELQGTVMETIQNMLRFNQLRNLFHRLLLAIELNYLCLYNKNSV